MNYLLDTCVISELVKPKPHPGVVAWIRSCPEELLYLSSLTIGELQKGVSKLTFSDKQSQLQDWINMDLLKRFAGRIIPVDAEVAQTWGRVQASAEQQGQPMSAMDGLIAASALTHNMEIVTRNTRDMEPSGARMINPWE